MYPPPNSQNYGNPAPPKSGVPWWVWLILALFLFCCMCPGGLFVAGVIGAAGTDAAQGFEEPAIPAPASEETPPADTSADLELLEHDWLVEDYTRMIVGTIRNNSNQSYSYAQIQINLLDTDGNVVGSTMANVNNLEPGATWKFKAYVMETGDLSYEIKEISGF